MIFDENREKSSKAVLFQVAFHCSFKNKDDLIILESINGLSRLFQALSISKDHDHNKCPIMGVLRDVFKYACANLTGI